MARTTTPRRNRTARAAGDGSSTGSSAAKTNEKQMLERIKALEAENAALRSGATIDAEDDDAARRRTEQIADLMDPRDHMRECPMDGRFEAYAARKPANVEQAIPAKDVTIVACIECGGRVVLDESYSDIIARLDQELGEG